MYTISGAACCSKHMLHGFNGGSFFLSNLLEAHLGAAFSILLLRARLAAMMSYVDTNQKPKATRTLSIQSFETPLYCRSSVSFTGAILFRLNSSIRWTGLHFPVSQRRAWKSYDGIAHQRSAFEQRSISFGILGFKNEISASSMVIRFNVQRLEKSRDMIYQTWKDRAAQYLIWT